MNDICQKDQTPTRSGFVAAFGRPNAGKSTLLNYLLGEKIALVSHKANATRKQLQMIVPYPTLNAQIIFIDTPGIHYREKLLNQYMLSQTMKAMGDCDLALYLAPVNDDVSYYEEFLKLSKGIKHFLLITKIDTCSKDGLLDKIAQYQVYDTHFLALLPISIKKKIYREEILHHIALHLPYAPFFYDETLLTSASLGEIYKEMIRESLFEHLSDEIPYLADVIIKSFESNTHLDKIYAHIIVEKQSQKAMVIGRAGSSIKRIGIYAREKMSALSGKKIFLKLDVEVYKHWSKQKNVLKKIGYDFE